MATTCPTRLPGSTPLRPSLPERVTTKRRTQITSFLRQRAVRALQTGTIRGGDRLPSTRAVAAELGVDPRLVLAAYRELAAEGLVELRERSGIFVASSRQDGSERAPAAPWLAELLAQGVAREVPAPELGAWLARATATRLQAAVVAATADQAEGICRELREYYGLDAFTLPPGAAPRVGGRVPTALRRAALVVTTEAPGAAVRRLGERLGIPVVAISVRADLVGPEWRLLLRSPVYVVVTDHRFVQTLRHYFADTPGVENIRPVVLGRDPLDAIPPGAATYVTHSARTRLGDTPIPGRTVPPARIFSEECAREILEIIVRKNLERAEARDG